MASTDARPVPRKSVAYRVTFPILDADGDLVTGAASLDSEVSLDGGTFADCTNEATEIATSSGMYFLDLTAGEMSGDTVAILVKTATAGAKTTPIVLYPEEAGDYRAQVTGMDAGVVTAAAIATGAIDADAIADGAIDAATFAAGAITAAAIATNAVDADALAADAITEIQSGLATSAEIAVVQADTDNIQTRLPAALVSGRMDSNMQAAADGVLTAAKFAAGAFDAVWTVSVRSLTTFGTLVADVATAIWGAATRTLTAFAFTPDVNLIQIGGDVDTLARLKRVTDSEVLGTAGSGSSVTSIVTSSLIPTAVVTDQFKGRIVLFERATTTAALRGQGTRVTASTSGGVLTVEELSTAPASGDTFTIV